MSLRESIQIALLLAIGYILHTVIPGYGGGMKPDLLLAMLFIAILLYPSFKSALLAGLIAGLITALTTSFPGGQLPNIIDKLLTSILVLGLVKVAYGRVNRYVLSGLIGIIGTLFSGVVFVGSALLIVGLPPGASFGLLMTTVVLPAAALNTVGIIILYPIVLFSKRIIDQNRNVPVGEETSK